MYSSKKIAEILQCKVRLSDDRVIKSISIDSRSIGEFQYSLFFAIKGKNHNGHTFIESLYQLGVRNFVVSEHSESESEWPEANIFFVEDTVVALQKLALYHRMTMRGEMVAVTGSNGKTIVKEWLAQMLSDTKILYRSPRSYNSQVGVPLALLGIEPQHELAIIEAGISEIGEMERLEAMICPEVVIFTHLGDAHDENFPSRQVKLMEKAKLFAHAPIAIGEASENMDKIFADMTHPNKILFTWSETKTVPASLYVESEIVGTKRRIVVTYHEKRIALELPFADQASFSNLMHVLSYLFFKGLDIEIIKRHLALLQPIAMRMEIKGGIGEAILIHDYYNSDLASFRIALTTLLAQDKSKKKVVVLSDFVGVGKDKEMLYTSVAQLLLQNNIDLFIGIGTQLEQYRQQFSAIPAMAFYKDVTAFLRSERRSRFKDKVVLLKGARRFKFERIASFLQKQSHTTMLEVDMDAMIANLNYFRGLIPRTTKTAVMVKAFSYGSGSSEIASLLQYHGVDYLMVAYVDEGVELRKNGITIPIAVMNPEIEAFEDMIEYQLEPEIYSMELLYRLDQKLALSGINSYPVHLKFNTGMNRSGMDIDQIEELLDFFNGEEHVEIQSMFSHLAGSDDPELDWFTHKQLALFEQMTSQMGAKLHYKPLRHILNSAGIERFASHHYEMVRLGIGLHGISAVNAKLQPVSRFKTYIVAIREVKKDESVGYGRKGVLQRDSRIAILPVGYADGWNRHLSCGVGEVAINGERVPIVGNICMDACMIDVTDINASVGDEVELFGKQISVTEIADKLETIAYEVLTSVSQRVKRVYYRE